MPKLKTRKSAAKRFKISSGGRIRHKHCFARHKLTGKRAARRRRLRHPGSVATGEKLSIRRMLPYQ